MTNYTAWYSFRISRICRLITGMLLSVFAFYALLYKPIIGGADGCDRTLTIFDQWLATLHSPNIQDSNCNGQLGDGIFRSRDPHTVVIVYIWYGKIEQTNVVWSIYGHLRTIDQVQYNQICNIYNTISYYIGWVFFSWYTVGLWISWVYSEHQ